MLEWDGPSVFGAVGEVGVNRCGFVGVLEMNGTAREDKKRLL